jgi:hypothetical protein
VGKWLPNDSFKPNPLRGFGRNFKYCHFRTSLFVAGRLNSGVRPADDGNWRSKVVACRIFVVALQAQNEEDRAS